MKIITTIEYTKMRRNIEIETAKAIFDDIREELKIKESDEPTDGYYWMKKEFDNLKKKWLK